MGLGILSGEAELIARLLPDQLKQARDYCKKRDCQVARLFDVRVTRGESGAPDRPKMSTGWWSCAGRREPFIPNLNLEVISIM